MNFNNNATSFDLTNAVFLAKLAKIAYINFKSNDFKNQLNTLGFDSSHFRTYDKDDTQALIIFDDEKIILAFRGTEPDSLRDWVTDAQVRKTAGVYGRVHRGFSKALNYVWEDMEEEVEKLLDEKRRKIWITGHSLGAALATLAMARLNALGEDIPLAGLYTFGQPRTGGKNFAKKFNSELKDISYRVVNNNDVVTRVPPRDFGYSHIGQLEYIDSDGEIHSDGSLSWWGKFWDRIEGRLDGFLELKLFDGVDDHSMNDYLSLLEKDLTKV